MSDDFDEFDDGLDLAQLDEAELESLKRIEKLPNQTAFAAAGPSNATTPEAAVSKPAPAPSSSIRPPTTFNAADRSIDDTFDQDDFDDALLLGIDELDMRLSGDGQSQQSQQSQQQQQHSAGDGPHQNPLFFMPSSPDIFAVPSAAAAVTAKDKATAFSRTGTSTRPTQQALAARPIGRTLSSSFARSSSNSIGGAASNRASSGVHRQMTLFGEAVRTSTPAKILPVSPGHVSASASSAPVTTGDGGGSGTKGARQMRQPTTKQWDRTAYAKSGKRKKSTGKGKGKGKRPDRTRDEFGAYIDGGGDDDDGNEEDEDDDDSEAGGEDWDAGSKWQHEPLPAPTDPVLQPLKPMKLQIDRETARTWIYPTNMEKRDYQFNIVQRSLFNNVLVALPTGLGKTFIAAVVVLNFFRWYPEGKIVFLAPTRPLVDQQKIACHGICGLPWETAVDLTGSTKRNLRGDYWQDKRIFYMTPQTFENDLVSRACDPRDIVCVVVDEAHRATGRYAYCNVISLLMQSNPHFRVLALTATPGGSSERVQEVIDRLHIGLIEIRTEKSLDIRKYVHKKHEETFHIALGRDLNAVVEKWGRLMKTHIDTLTTHGLLHPSQQNPVLLHPWAVRCIMKNPRNKKERPQCFKPAEELAKMAMLMQHLMEQSVTMFYRRVLERLNGTDDKGKKAATKKQQQSAHSNSTYREIVRELEMMQDEKGRIIHPKMVKLKELVEEHFSKHRIDQILAEDVEGSGGGDDDDDNGAAAPGIQHRKTRVMVFCSFRECVTEIVEYLNESGLKVTPFVGQAASNKGGKGMTQRDQERVIQQFKRGEFNVLVATSIGEEGLDIGDVDLTVCYEAVKDSVRMLQRVGRTGRKRDGKIVVLMSAGREEVNWRQSKDAYRNVQKEIDSGLAVALYDDVKRMVPDDIRPEPELRKVDQPKFEPSMVSDGRKAPRGGAQKRKRNSDPARNVPEGMMMGFLTASKLAKKRKKGDDQNGDDDDDESGDDPATVRRKKMLLSSSSQSDSEAKRVGGTSSGRPISSANNRGDVDGGVDSDDDADAYIDQLLQRGLFSTARKPVPPTTVKQDTASKASALTTPPARAAASGSPLVQSESQNIDRSNRRRLGTRRAAASAISTLKLKPETACIEILDSSQDVGTAPPSKLALQSSISANRIAPFSPQSSKSSSSAGGGGKPRTSTISFDTGHPSSTRVAKRAVVVESDDDDEFGSMQVDSDIERQIGDITQAAIRPRSATTPRQGQVHEQGQGQGRRQSMFSAASPPGVLPLALNSPPSSPPRNDDEDETVTSPLRACKLAPHPLVAALLADLDAEVCASQEGTDAAPTAATAATAAATTPGDGVEEEVSSPVKVAVRTRRRGKAAASPPSAPPADDASEVGSLVDAAATCGVEEERPEQQAVPAVRRRGARRILATSSQSPPPPDAAAAAASRAGRVATEMSPPDSIPRRPRTLLPDPEESPLSRPAKPRRRLVPASASASATSAVGPSRSAVTASTPPRPAPPAKKAKKAAKKRISASPTSRALFRYEAERSTDEEAHGERDEDDSGSGSDQEDDEDRRHVGHFEPTQAPRGYNQRSVYMGSLLTQNAPTPFRRPANRTPFPGVGGRFGLQQGQGKMVGYSQDSQDRYSQDSFVVGDEEEIEYDTDHEEEEASSEL